MLSDCLFAETTLYQLHYHFPRIHVSANPSGSVDRTLVDNRYQTRDIASQTLLVQALDWRAKIPTEDNLQLKQSDNFAEGVQNAS